MRIEQLDEWALKCMTDDGPKLGFPTGIATRRFSSADTVAIRNSQGIVIDSAGKTTPWPIEKFIEHEGNMVAVGPWLEGSRPFNDAVVDLKMLSRLQPAIRVLKAAGFPLKGLYSSAIRWLADGGVLIYPPKLAEWVRELNQDEKWIHPDRQGEAAWSYSLGVLAWQIITGVDPFADETGEARRERIRRAVLQPLDALRPGVHQQAEVTIRGALLEVDEEMVPNLDEWDKLIRRWQREGIVSDLTESEIEDRKFRAGRKSGNVERELRARRWFRNSGWKLLTAIAASAAVLAFISAPIRKALETPITAGMNRFQVAEVYYSAIDAMDSQLMDDCLAKKVGKDDVRLVDTVFVTTKVRQGYEGTGEMPIASDWIESGKPDLPAGMWPWGISDLKISDLGGDRIEARYNIWTPPVEGREAEISAWSTSRIDILSFIEGRKSWEISNIDRTTVD